MENKTLMKFWAPWCGPCKQLSATMAGLNFEESLTQILEVNVDEDPEAAARHNVMGVPTLILFKNGQEVARKSGNMTAPQVVQFIEQV